MAPTTYLRIGLFLILLLGRHGSMAELKPGRNGGGLSFGQAAAAAAGASSSSGCEFAFDRLQPVDPLPKMRAETGTLEYFNDANQQLRCAGVFMVRVVVDNRGLLLPRYTNGGALCFIVKGRGVVGITFPGCPKTPPRRFTEGDVIAVQAGVPIWIYNDGSSNSTPLEFVVVFTVGGPNQLDTQHRDFVLAGSNGNRSRSILDGFTVESLSKSFGVSQGLARRHQDQNDQRGTIVRVPAGLLLPSLQPDQKNQLNDTMAAHHQFQASIEEDVLPGDDKMCRMKVTMNLGETTTLRLTGREFPILNSVGLSIERGTLKPNAILSPRYTIDAQSVVYVTWGSVTLQVVDNRSVAVFDGVLRPGQPLVVPPYYVVLAEAGEDGAEIDIVRVEIDIVLNTDAIVTRITGRGSVLRGLPVGVIVAAYNVSASDAIKIKNSGGN